MVNESSYHGPTRMYYNMYVNIFNKNGGHSK